MTKSAGVVRGQFLIRTIALAVLVSLLASGCKTSGASKSGTAAASSKGDTAAAGDETLDPVVPADPAWLAEVTALDPSIRKGVLPNGLTYYLVRNNEPAKRASMWLAVNTGSVMEDDDQRGLAHFVEHMAFNGTAKFPKHAIIEAIERFGMKFGADLNAYTSFDATVYQLKVPTDEPKNIATAFDILRDWAGDISFDTKEIESERGVVMEEWRLRQGAGMRVAEKQLPLQLKGSKYAERLPIGLPDIIKGASRDTIVRFYKDWYRPDLMAVIVVGDLDLDAAEADIKARFASLTNPKKARPRAAVTVPLDHETIVSLLADKEMPVSAVSVSDKVPAPSESTIGDYRDYLLEALASAMIGERMGELVKEADSPFLFPPAIQTSEMLRDVAATQRIAVAKPGRSLDALKSLMTENARAAQHGFLASELARAKKSLLRTYESSAKEIESRDSADIADELTRNFFEAEQVPGRVGELALVEKLLPTIGLSDMNTYVRRLGTARGRIISVVANKESDLPKEADVLRVVAEAEKSVTKREEAAISGSILDAKPTPGAVLSERKDDKLGITEWKLSNGATVVLKPTDFDADTILLSGFAKGGYSLASDAQLWSAKYADGIVGQSGVGTLSDSDLQKTLAGKMAFANTWIGEYKQGVTGRSSRDDFELMLQILNARIAQPRIDAQAFSTWKATTIGLVRDRDASPEASFSDKVRRAQFGNHLRRRSVEVADVESVKMDEAFAFYRDRFSDVSGFTFVFVGKIDVAAAKPLIETYIASLPGSAKAPRNEMWKDAKAYRLAGKQGVNVKAGSEPKSMVSMSTWLLAKWSLPLEADAHILRMALHMRLIEVLRENMAGVYGVGVGLDLSRIPREAAVLSINFGCAPENVVALQKAARAELAGIAKKGVDAAYLEKIASQLRREREEQLRSNRWWSDVIVESYEYGDPLPALIDVEAAVARVTNANIKALAKRLVASKNTFTGVLDPAK